MYSQLDFDAALSHLCASKLNRIESTVLTRKEVSRKIQSTFGRACVNIKKICYLLLSNCGEMGN